jgi:hypothetical protein
VPRFVAPAVFALAAVLSAQSTAFFPLKDIRPGMRGTGRTVFNGSRVEDFQVEVLGVLENFGPKQSLILARLSGGPLEHTGVMQGMSGSPVYIDGKLAGAVAMAFPFSKDPIAGIRPIEEMVRATGPSANADATPPGATKRSLFASRDLTSPFSRPEAPRPGDAQMIDIATPLSFGGFTRATLDAFAPQLRPLGLEPRQSVTAGANIAPGMGNPADLKPGSMISVQLVSGDFSVAADGTVTHIDGNRVYAFGHRFLDVGATALPFARADVVALIPNVNTAFKLSTAREWMGTISQDRDTAISGELGKRVPLVPLTIEVVRAGKSVQSYKVQMVNDPLLSPLLMQMSVFSSIDATERTTGVSTLRLSGEIEFENAPAPIRLDNTFSADNGTALQASLSAAIPVAYIMQSSFNKGLPLKRATLRVEAFDQKKQLNIESVTASKREVHPGDRLTLHVLMTGENGAEVTRQVVYDVPIGAEPGTVYFTVADANIANISDFRAILTTTPRTVGQLVSTVNNLHPNTKAYVRVWKADPAFQLEGSDMPDPPASISLILGGSPSSIAGVTQVRNSKIAEMEIDGGGMVVSGVKTVQVEIKE